MSLVLDALRRLEKSEATPGTVGVRVASYRPPHRKGRSWTPLILGIAFGGAAVFLFLPAYEQLRTKAAPGDDVSAPLAPARTGLGGAGLPPPLILEVADSPLRARNPPGASGAGETLSRGAALARAAPKSSPALILQAISERDSHPIAVINELLVKEGDLIGSARVVKIGADSVEILLASGIKELLRFAPPPPDASPSPDGR